MAVHNLDTRLCKSCKLCVNICPKHVYEISDNINAKGYNTVTAVRPEDCIQCKLCEKICPDFVIYIEKTPKK